MCSVVAAASLAGGLFGGALLGQAMKPKLPSPPEPPPTASAQQAAKNPSWLGMRRQNAQQAANQGPASTLLTGPRGIDPNTLTLGRTTLLGS